MSYSIFANWDSDILTGPMSVPQDVHGSRAIGGQRDQVARARRRSRHGAFLLWKQIQQYRTDHKVDDVSLYAEIDDIFNKYKIHRWDDAFSLVHTIDPVEKDFVDAQNTIDQALAVQRRLGMHEHHAKSSWNGEACCAANDEG